MLRPARQQRCSGGGADGSAGVELGEEDALSRHPDGGQCLQHNCGSQLPPPVNVWRLHGGVARHPQVPPAQVVHVDEDEVRLGRISGGRIAGSMGHKQQQEQRRSHCSTIEPPLPVW